MVLLLAWLAFIAVALPREGKVRPPAGAKASSTVREPPVRDRKDPNAGKRAPPRNRPGPGRERADGDLPSEAELWRMLYQQSRGPNAGTERTERPPGPPPPLTKAEFGALSNKEKDRLERDARGQRVPKEEFEALDDQEKERLIRGRPFMSEAELASLPEKDRELITMRQQHRKEKLDQAREERQAKLKEEKLDERKKRAKATKARKQRDDPQRAPLPPLTREEFDKLAPEEQSRLNEARKGNMLSKEEFAELSEVEQERLRRGPPPLTKEEFDALSPEDQEIFKKKQFSMKQREKRPRSKRFIPMTMEEYEKLPPEEREARARRGPRGERHLTDDQFEALSQEEKDNRGRAAGAEEEERELTEEEKKRREPIFQFGFGSCLDPGFAPFKILGDIQNRHAESPMDFFFFLGDQIYLDRGENDLWTCPEPSLDHPYAAECVRKIPKEDLEKLYQQKMDHLLSEPYFNKFIDTVPSVFMWDDHEFFGGYHEGKNSTIYQIARRHFMESFGHRNPKPYRPGELYFQIKKRPHADFFVMDRRSYNTNPFGKRPTVLGAQQVSDVFDWLKNSKSRWKFLISSTQMSRFSQIDPSAVIETLQKGENLKDNRPEGIPEDYLPRSITHDGWMLAGYQRERELITNYIANHNIPGVIILSGDSHFTSVIEMRIGDPKHKPRCILTEINVSALAADPQAPPDKESFDYAKYFEDRIMFGYGEPHMYSTIDISVDFIHVKIYSAADNTKVSKTIYEKSLHWRYPCREQRKRHTEL